MVDFITIDGLSELEWAFLVDIYGGNQKGKKLGALPCEFGSHTQKALKDLKRKGLITLEHTGGKSYIPSITDAGIKKLEKVRGASA